MVLSLDRTHPKHVTPQFSLQEWSVCGLGSGIGTRDVGDVVEAWHLHGVGVELLYMMYKLRHTNTLGLLVQVSEIILLLLSHVDGEHSEKVKHHTIFKRLM